MSYSIVYSSRTGNTKMLAERIRETLPAEECIYFGEAAEEALRADRIYAGFWTDKGSCDSQTTDFLRKVTTQEVFLFGTAGFGGSQEYFDKVLRSVAGKLGGEASVVGSFMCQGKMPMSVRERYEKLMKSPIPVPKIKGMIENFDKALSHPDAEDLDHLKRAVEAVR